MTLTDQWLTVRPPLTSHILSDNIGSGESVRGNINSFVDNLGQSAQNSNSNSGSGLQGSGNSAKDVEKDVENRATDAKGREEMQSGLNAFRK